MTTINKIKETINLEELKNNNEFGLSEVSLYKNDLFMKIWIRIKDACVKQDTNETRKGIELSSSYILKITSEDVLNTLRQLYTNTKNKFVKKVIETVGKSKIMTEKQTDIIIEEMMKFNVTLNF